MATEPLIWTAWNKGRHHSSGNGYGLKIPIRDRDLFFDPKIGSAILVLPDGEREICINTEKNSFWSDTCRELISKDLGRWFIRKGLAPWPAGAPPKIRAVPLGRGKFKIEGNA
jgi:hypothetical protein